MVQMFINLLKGTSSAQEDTSKSFPGFRPGTSPVYKWHKNTSQKHDLISSLSSYLF